MEVEVGLLMMSVWGGEREEVQTLALLTGYHRQTHAKWE